MTQRVRGVSRASVATRSDCAAAVTCEKRTGVFFEASARKRCAIGSASATRAGRQTDDEKADANDGRKQRPAKKAAKQLDAGAEDDGEWEEVVRRRKKKSASES